MRREDKILMDATIDDYWWRLYNRAMQRELKNLVSLDCLPDELDYQFAKEFALDDMEEEIYYNHIAAFADEYHYSRRLVKRRFRLKIAQFRE